MGNPREDLFNEWQILKKNLHDHVDRICRLGASIVQNQMDDISPEQIAEWYKLLQKNQEQLVSEQYKLNDLRNKSRDFILDNIS